jgi:hypothetical protein
MKPGISKELLNLQNEIASLHLYNKKLKGENECLKKRIDFYEKHPWVVTGLRGETIIATLIDGSTTSYTYSHDIEIERRIYIYIYHF